MAKNKGKKVAITMITDCKTPDGFDHSEIITEGYLEKIDDKNGYLISYEDTEATGFNGTKTLVTCYGNNRAVMERVDIKTKDIMTRLTMERNAKQHCFYGTEFGELTLGVYTNKIDNRITDDGGNLCLRYTLDVNSSLIAENEINIRIK